MGDELQDVVDDNGDADEADRLEPGDQGSRVDGIARIVDVEAVETVARQAVGRHEDTAGAEHSERLGEDGILARGGRHVVEHREAANRVEGVVVVCEPRRVSRHDSTFVPT